MMSVMAKILVCIQVLLLINISVAWPSKRKNTCPADAKEEWSYNGLNGPPYWGETFPDCYGMKQSPIALTRRNAVFNNTLEKLNLVNYDQPITKAKIENNGHTVQITPDDGIERSISVQGDTYSLRQLHFHWGDRYYRGSEHTLEGIRFAMEMHLVHMNSRNQIAVVGVFIQTFSPDNTALKPIVDDLPSVQFKGNNKQLSSSLNLNGLLPNNPASYYRYDGSLTTPACSEGVSWSVLRKPIGIGKSQIDQFRKLNSADDSAENADCKLVNNFRPLQPLNGRTVYVSR